MWTKHQKKVKKDPGPGNGCFPRQELGQINGLLVGTVQEGFWLYLTGWRRSGCESLVPWGFVAMYFCVSSMWWKLWLWRVSSTGGRERQARKTMCHYTEYVTQSGHILARVAALGSQQGAPPLVLPRTDILVISHLALLMALFRALLLLVSDLWAHKIPHTQTDRFPESRVCLR